jgi:cardiolipin synthase (CMP-forming)
MVVWLAVIILGRDFGLGIAAIYYRYISLPPPKTFMRYWDFSLPSAEVHPTQISKVTPLLHPVTSKFVLMLCQINTLLQLILIGASTIQPILIADITLHMHILQYREPVLNAN